MRDPAQPSDTRRDRGSRAWRRASQHTGIVANARCIAAVVIAICVLGGCATQPSTRSPALASRQVAALRALGFIATDEGWLLDLPEPIYFDFDKAEPKPGLERDLAPIAAQLRRVGIHALRIVGHTDSSGPRDVNVDLSRRRADAVARALVRHGFDATDIERVGDGPDHPVADDATAAGRARNRHVDIIVPALTLRTD